ncbi:uncharacterized protein VTP21DRAFT_10471 [Calcarisporiella thermophila]|uniref:uncharacterized protein n=1 Tax=Calcarisporiella thermophila TaxID=911321 RepID=UPI0037425945
MSIKHEHHKKRIRARVHHPFQRRNVNHHHDNTSSSQRHSPSHSFLASSLHSALPSVASSMAPSSSSTATPSAPQAMEIPGFYYDAAKNRYFKIVANSSGNHPYSSQSIKRKRQEEIEQPTEPISPQNIKFSGIRYLLRRNIEYQYRSWANEGNARLCTVKGLCLRKTIKENFQSVKHILVEPKDNIFYASSNRSLHCFGFGYSSPDLNPESFAISHNRLLWNSPTEITSLNFGPERSIVSTNFGNANFPGQVRIEMFPTRTSLGEEISLDSASWVLNIPKSSVWSSDVHDQLIAAGATKKVVLATVADPTRRKRFIMTGSDVFVARFCPGVGGRSLLAGCRDGRVMLFDVREPNRDLHESGASQKMRGQLAIRYPSSVCEIQSVDGDHLYVGSGMDGALYLFDTRCLRNNHPPRPPLFSFNGHRNKLSLGLGFAVDSTGTGLAAAGNDGFIRLYTLGPTPDPNPILTLTPDHVRSTSEPCPTPDTIHEDNRSLNPVTSLHFIDPSDAMSREPWWWRLTDRSRDNDVIMQDVEELRLWRRPRNFGLLAGRSVCTTSEKRTDFEWYSS